MQGDAEGIPRLFTFASFFDLSVLASKMEPVMGIEPATCCLRISSPRYFVAHLAYSFMPNLRQVARLVNSNGVDFVDNPWTSGPF